MERELTLSIVLERRPKGVDFGLQKGRGSAYGIVQTQRSRGNDLNFQFSVGVKVDSNPAVPALVGPFVQGTAGQRFVYIDIGTYAGQADSCWSRRLEGQEPPEQQGAHTLRIGKNRPAIGTSEATALRLQLAPFRRKRKRPL